MNRESLLQAVVTCANASDSLENVDHTFFVIFAFSRGGLVCDELFSTDEVGFLKTPVFEVFTLEETVVHLNQTVKEVLFNGVGLVSVAHLTIKELEAFVAGLDISTLALPVHRASPALQSIYLS